MCLAEALLRIPDKATRDALIRDKISNGQWDSHLGKSPSLVVNAATWGLLITGKLVSTNSEKNLGSALTRLIAKGGEPLIRKGVDMAMRMLGNQFVTGQTIEEALKMYERAMFLDPADVDAKANYELALQLKEKIQQQQQQQQQNQQQEQKKDQPPPPDKKEEERKQDEKQDQQPPQQEQKQDQQQPQEQPSQQEPTPAEQMTPEDARMLLDRMKQEEQSYRDNMQVIMGRPVPVDKDW